MKKLLLFFMFLSMPLLSQEYSNDYGMNENWRIVLELQDVLDAYPLREWVRSFSNGNAEIQFWDSLNGIAQYGYRHFVKNVGNDDVVYNIFYRTTDGGYSWTVSAIDSAYQKEMMTLISGFDIDNNGLVIANAGIERGENHPDAFVNILKSTDYGTTWRTIELDFNDLAKEIAFYDQDTIFACYEMHVLKSVDGGETWSIINDEFKVDDTGHDFRHYESLDISDDGTIFLTTTHSYGYNLLFRSMNGGKSWERFELPLVWGNQVEAIDAHNWYVNICDYQFNRVGLLKCSDDNQHVDTLLWEIGKPTWWGKVCANGDYVLADFGFAKTHLSTDGGKSFESIISRDVENFIRGNYWTAAWPKPGLTILIGYLDSSILLHELPTAVELDKIQLFNSKVYPNPCYRDAMIYIGLENDRDRLLRCKTYNSAGELMSESHEIHAPKGYHTIDYKTTGFSAGAYFLVIESDGEIIAREKFIVE